MRIKNTGQALLNYSVKYFEKRKAFNDSHLLLHRKYFASTHISNIFMDPHATLNLSLLIAF